MQTLLDPARPDLVGAALLACLRQRLHDDALAFAEAPESLGRGFSSFIYAFRMDGAALPPAWQTPLVLRVLPSPDAGHVVRREAEVQHFAAGHAYPALVPLVVEPGVEEIGLPFVIMARVPGVTVLERITKNPLAAPRLFARMADLHADLHRLPIDGCPLPYEQPTIDRWLADLRRRIADAGADAMEPGLRRLEEHRALALDEQPVLCHNDFHPLNVMVGGDHRMTVLDWTDAAIGDRHSDVARTVTLVWFAEVAAQSAVERFILRSARGFLRSRYLAPYRRRFPLDERRFRYWEALHGFYGWLQLVELAARGGAGAESKLETVQRIPSGAAAMAERYFWRKCRRL